MPLANIREGKIKERLAERKLAGLAGGEEEEQVSAKEWIRDKAMSKRLGVPGGYRGKESFDPRREMAREVLGDVVSAR